MSRQNKQFIQNAFSEIADRYVVTNHVLSLGMDILWRRKVAQIIKREGAKSILDVATGSGDLARSVSALCPDSVVTGVDFCLPMLKQAAARKMKRLVAADGLFLPFSSNIFDAVTIGFGLRNMVSWSSGLREMGRILKPGGLLVVLDFSLPQQKRYVLFIKSIWENCFLDWQVG